MDIEAPKKARERKGHGAIDWTLKAFGTRSLYFLLPVVLFPYFLTGGAERRATFSFFKRVFGFTGWKLWWHAWLTWWQFGVDLVDRVVMAQLESQDTLPVPPEFPPTREAAHALYMGAHVGSWSVVGPKTFLQRGIPVAIVADVRQGDHIVRQWGHDPLVRFLPMGENPMAFVMALREAMDEKSALLALGDRGLSSGYFVREFFKGQVQFPKGMWDLAARQRLPVFAIFSFRLGHGPTLSWETRLFPLGTGSGKNAEELFESWFQVFVNIAKTYPHHWFHFTEFWMQPI